MGGTFPTISKSIGAAACLLAVSLFPVSAIAGGGDSYQSSPAPSGRTIWEGFHVGVHGGWADQDFGIGQTNPASALVTRSDSDDGFVGGFLYGSQWQFGNYVLGTDSAYSFGDTKTGLNTAANGLSATAEVEWSAESRVRAGVLVQPNILVYGTLGIAFANLDVSGTLIAGGSDDDRAFGISYGAGVETTLGNRGFARLEYIHTDYDEESFRQTGGGSFDVDLDTDVIRGAIGYRFDWSPLDLLN
jgi:outer membrane immunogenic protein